MSNSRLKKTKTNPEIKAFWLAIACFIIGWLSCWTVWLMYQDYIGYDAFMQMIERNWVDKDWHDHLAYLFFLGTLFVILMTKARRFDRNWTADETINSRQRTNSLSIK